MIFNAELRDVTVYFNSCEILLFLIYKEDAEKLKNFLNIIYDLKKLNIT